jgi:hypothetical protein
MEQEQQRALAIQQKQAQREENRRRKKNAQRLEAQRREFDRKCEARKKAEEKTVAAATAAASSHDAGDDSVSRAQTGSLGEPGPEGHSKPVELRSRRRQEKAPQTQPERGQQLEPPGVETKTKIRVRVRTKRGKGSGAAAKPDDQKVNTKDDRAAELLRRGAETASWVLAITNGEEHTVSPLMTHVRVCHLHWSYETDRNINPSHDMIMGLLIMLSQHQRCLLHRL